MLNRIVLIGRLTHDPEIRYTPSGTPVTKFTIAVDRRFGKDGQKETDFIDIVVWSKAAENCANYLGKGRLVAVDGRLQIRSYDDSQGIRRKAAEVIAENVRFLDRAKEDQGTVSRPTAPNKEESFASEVSFVDDDMPF